MRATTQIAVVFTAACALGLIVGFGMQAPKVLPKLEDFKAWHKVNDRPYPMTPEAVVLCRMPSPVELRTGKFAAKPKPEMGPHADKWVTVWVNETGKAAMRSGKPFPIGSAIVKEKTDQFASQSTFATAMIKREKGFNPDCGDWEFATLSLPETKVTLRGKLKPCMNCHKARSDSDYTFRPYVGDTSRRKG